MVGHTGERRSPAPREVRFLSEVKTLVSVSEAELGMAALADITVVQGDPAEFQVQIPPGYEVTGRRAPAWNRAKRMPMS